jgi:uncharacterized protein (DUF362 family)
MPGVTVAIVADPALTKEQKLLAALEQAELWGILESRRSASADPLQIVIKPDFGAFASDSPTATDPLLVEILIDIFHDHGHTKVMVGSAVEESSIWAENRDVFALAELLGYHFVTPKGRSYDVADLSNNIDETIFSSDSVLHGTGLSRVWANAHCRIVFSKNKTDEYSGYSLCLESLIGVLPLADKRRHYRIARDAGEVVADLLAVAPVHFAIIDALTSAHGAGGRRAPDPIETTTIIACPAICLADQIGAMKMGLDPFESAVFAKVVARHPLPRRYDVHGSLGIFPQWRNVPAPLVQSSRYRATAAALERLVTPWLQHLNTELFPLKSSVDAQANAYLADFFRNTDSSPTSRWLLIIANVLLGFIGHVVECYRTLFDKDSIRQKIVGLGIDLKSYVDDHFWALVDELLQLEVMVADAPEVRPGLRWRYLDGAVLFSYVRILPIAFDTFVGSIDIARTIQYMNDYLGGIVVPLAHDDSGRPVRQAERNLYLPQPNYLILYDGKPIDVTKLEVVEYQLNRHRLFWKTVRSENASAIFDDGIATFSRHQKGTMVAITGRQRFVLPPFWQVVDLNLVPDIKAALVSDAYQIFFDRTVANFEALVEGREIRLGRPAGEPSRLEADALVPLLQWAGELIGLLLQQGADGPIPTSGVLDPDGFVHVTPDSRGISDTYPPAWTQEISRFLQGLVEAVLRDFRQRSSAR